MKINYLIIQFLILILLSSCANDSSRYSDAKYHENGDLDNTFKNDSVVTPKVITPEEALKLEKEKLLSEGWEENDMKNGQGKITYNDGSNYEGGWYGDKKHGEGKLTDAEGKITFGLWRFNKLSVTYPILKVSRDVFVKGCEKFSTLDKWENNDIIMLYNPPRYAFDVTKPIVSITKFTYNICNYIFTGKELEGLKEIVKKNEDEDEDEDEEYIIRNPYTREIMNPEYFKLYVLSITGPPVPEVSSAGGKSKRRQRLKRTYKKNNKKRQTKRKLH